MNAMDTQGIKIPILQEFKIRSYPAPLFLCPCFVSGRKHVQNFSLLAHDVFSAPEPSAGSSQGHTGPPPVWFYLFVLKGK